MKIVIITIALVAVIVMSQPAEGQRHAGKMNPAVLKYLFQNLNRNCLMAKGPCRMDRNRQFIGTCP
uniref:Uncharacterized protein n=1 Tax=Ciona savignyi TaxID=51511 RepID=H2YMV9_CIOSA